MVQLQLLASAGLLVNGTNAITGNQNGQWCNGAVAGLLASGASQRSNAIVVVVVFMFLSPVKGSRTLQRGEPARWRKTTKADDAALVGWTTADWTASSSQTALVGWTTAGWTAGSLQTMQCRTRRAGPRSPLALDAAALPMVGGRPRSPLAWGRGHRDDQRAAPGEGARRAVRQIAAAAGGALATSRAASRGATAPAMVESP